VRLMTRSPAGESSRGTTPVIRDLTEKPYAAKAVCSKRTRLLLAREPVTRIRCGTLCKFVTGAKFLYVLYNIQKNVFKKYIPRRSGEVLFLAWILLRV
jgi:hypothetical protein